MAANYADDTELKSELDMTTVGSRIALLEADARTGFLILMERVLRTLENQEGCVLAMVDEKGEGNLAMLALGNQLLSTPILGAVAGLYETMSEYEGHLQ